MSRDYMPSFEAPQSRVCDFTVLQARPSLPSRRAQLLQGTYAPHSSIAIAPVSSLCAPLFIQTASAGQALQLWDTQSVIETLISVPK